MAYSSYGKCFTKNFKKGQGLALANCTSYLPIKFHSQNQSVEKNFTSNINYPNFFFLIGTKNVHDKDKAVQYDPCKLWINIKCNNLKGALSGLRQFLATEIPLKMMENAFHFTLETLFVLKIFKILSWIFGHVKKRLD